MSTWRRFLLRLYTFFRPARAERDLTREVDTHLALLADDFERKGMTPDAARVAARRAFSGVEQAKERSRDERSLLWLEDARRDIRFAVRMLGRAPAFSGVAVLTLALGIGGTTAIFSVVNGVILEPVGFPDARALVSVRHAMPGVGPDDSPLSRAMYLTFREHATTLDEIGIYRTTAVSVTGLGEPERLQVALVTEGLFPVLGVHPILGRAYTSADVAPGSEYPVMLSWGYWLRRFGGDEDVVGRTVRINGTPRVIIGVLPDGVREAFGDVTPELYLPTVIDPVQGVGNWSYPGFARLRPGVTPAQASDDLNSLTRLATELYPGIPLEELEAREFSTFVRPLKEELVGEASRALWIVFGTVGLVLFIACANVANLFLVRAEGRQRDVAVRTAIGASKGRLVRQFLTESVVVGLLGGGAGLLLAFGGLQLFLRVAPSSIPRLESIGLDSTALAFSSVVSVLAGLAFGMIPIFRHGRPGPTEPLKEGGRAVKPGWRWVSLRTLLAVSQIALALVLLIGSGLMVRSFQALYSVPPGFHEPEEVLTFRLSVPAADASTGEEAARMHQRILDAISGLPGVETVSAATSVTMDAWSSWDDISVEQFPDLDDGVQPLRRLNWITPGYFATLQNRVLEGREFEWADLYGLRDVVVVTENFAREFWDEPRRALGRRIRNDDDHPWLEIVGVVEDVHTEGLAEPPPSVIYMPFLLSEFWGTPGYVWRDLRYAVRTSRTEPSGMLPEVREVVWSVNDNLPLFLPETLDEILAKSLSRTSFTLVMLGLAGGAALLLAVVGVYGVISYEVAQRTQEIGVRMALGARPIDVFKIVVRQGGMLAIAGVCIGLPTAAGLSGLITAMLFDVKPVDPFTYGTLAAVLAGVVLLASYLPARRAAAVDPTVALRWE